MTQVQTSFKRVSPAFLMGLLLFVVTAWLYWPTTQYSLLIYDDDRYVTDNGWVKVGLSLRATNALVAYAGAHANLGDELAFLQRFGEAGPHLQAALKVKKAVAMGLPQLAATLDRIPEAYKAGQLPPRNPHPPNPNPGHR